MATAPTLESVIEYARPLVAAGAALHWLHPFDHVDENGYRRGKTPRAPRWAEAPRFTLGQLERFYDPRSNIGVRLGAPSQIGNFYLHLIDLDIRVAEKADEAWGTLLAIWPEARSFPTVISGSGGASRHIYFLTREPLRKFNIAKSAGHHLVWMDSQQRNVSHNDWEIDLMGTGSQAVLPPSLHPDTGLPYRWERPLDLSDIDFGVGPILPLATVQGWGARTAAPAGDEDDLEALFGSAPLLLEGDEIDRVLANIPNDTEEFDAEGNLIRTGAHYDDYIEVGMALHHQFEGSDEGFEKWVAWASQSSKFDLRHARYRWDKSFGGTLRPVRMATLIQKANNNRLKSEHDFDLADDFDLAGTAVALRPSTDLSELLDGAERPVVAAVPQVERPPEDWQSLFHRNEDGELKSTLPNARLMVKYDPRTFMVPAYNEFIQGMVFRRKPKILRRKRETFKEVLNLDSAIWDTADKVNGRLWEDAHDHAVRAVFEAPTTQGGYGIKISDRDLTAALGIVAQENRFHPIRDLLSREVWDGKKRMERLFVDYLGSPDDEYHRDAARLVLLGAVTRIFEPGHKFDFVAIFEGAQGKGKSSFIRTLALHWYNELSGDPSDTKAMVELMQGSWILEMGEMSSMAKTEVNDMKAFVTRQVDKVRTAYARRASEFRRQCIFMGSTNDREYLRDTTGGRRWWPIKCNIVGFIDNHRLAGEVLQIWAEAVAEYHALRAKHPYGELPLFLRNQEAATQALLLQDSRRTETAEEILAGQIEQWLDTPEAQDFDDMDGQPGPVRHETCIQQIWKEMLGRDGVVPQVEASRIGKAMTMLDGWDRTSNRVVTHEINKRYGKCRVYVRRR